MRVSVLGSAAGGGFPQWNCACRNCSRLRAGQSASRPRTQAQVVVRSSSGQSFLLNASPDLRAQILAAPLLAPAKFPRDTPISGVLLTSADVDCVAGLLHLRESQPLHIYATPSVRRILLEENRIFRVLDRATPPAVWHDIPRGDWFPLAPTNCAASADAALRCRAVPLGGKYPDYVSDALRPSLAPDEAVIALVVADKDKQMIYAPSIPCRSDDLEQLTQSSDLCLLDGTFWSDGEMISAGAGSKTAREIGHLPLDAQDGPLNQYRSSAGCRRVLIHMNNTNPILDEESAEHREVRSAGWEIAYDGMEFEL
jgi:pyrroloquinoline quinone biosynthesis protein B